LCQDVDEEERKKGETETKGNTEINLL